MLRIGLCQCRLSFEQPEENLAMMERFLLCSTAGKADLLLFPELTLSGFTMKSAEFAVTPDSRLIRQVCGMAARYETAIGFGAAIREAEKSGKEPEISGLPPRNSFLVINKNGELIADYAKLHPFSFSGEDRHYRPGSALSTFTLSGVRFGVTICYDLRFPEIYQAYADTCDAIIVAANWPAKRAEHWQTLIRARAVETQAYIAAVNCIGDMDGQYYQGDSRIIGPGGEFPPQEWINIDPNREQTREGILTAVLDEERVRRERGSFPVRQDRRPAFYREIL